MPCITYYEYLTQQSEKFTAFAKNTSDAYLKTYYSRAARGYIMRRDALSIDEACRPYAGC